jgi:hypothetical protein
MSGSPVAYVFKPGFGRYKDMGFVPETITVSVLNISEAANGGVFVPPPAFLVINLNLGWNQAEILIDLPPSMNLPTPESVVFTAQIYMVGQTDRMAVYSTTIKTDVLFVEDNFFFGMRGEGLPAEDLQFQIEVGGKFKALTDTLRAQSEFEAVELSSVAYRGFVEGVT